MSEYVELNSFSTFMVSANARYFTSVTSIADIQELIALDVWNDNKRYILGEGSNTLFVGDVDALVVKNEMVGLEVLHEDDEFITIRVGAGENWHNLVLWSLDQNLWGFENLVLIPGTVGASPVQNIGAYGADVSQTITLVEAVDTQSGEIVSFSNTDCAFLYRDSRFKQEPGRYFITYVQYTLIKQAKPDLSYGRVAQEVQKLELQEIKPLHVAQAVMTIRDSKLPRIDELGTAGSFFKNPIVSKDEAQKLKGRFPDMVQYHVESGVKLSAAWLIDYLGYKGKREGSVGTYKKHALVLVNHGGATGKDVHLFAQKIVEAVAETFGVTLEPEVNIIGA